VEIVTDRKNGVTNLISELGLPWEHQCDGNHVIKSVQARFAEHLSYRPVGWKVNKRVLQPIHDGLMSWFYACARLAGSEEEKREMWMGALAHYTREESKWKHKNDPAAVACLEGFLLAAAPELSRYQRENSTNVVESLNSLRAKKAGKDYAWKSSWRGRAYVGVLEFNEGKQWIIEFCEWAGIELPPGYVEHIQKKTDENFELRRRRATAEYRAFELKARMSHKEFLAGLAKNGVKSEVVHIPPRVEAVGLQFAGLGQPPERVEALVESAESGGGAQRAVVVGALRALVRQPPVRDCYGEAGEIAAREFVGFENEDRMSCHLSSALCMIFAVHRILDPRYVVRESSIEEQLWDAQDDARNT
jgi:hypothetical protein